MTLFKEKERKFAETISDLAFCNPFLPMRKKLEKEAPGKEFIATDPIWSYHGELNEKLSNVPSLVKQVQSIVDDLNQRLQISGPEDRTELGLYTDLVLFLLYHTYVQRFFVAIEKSLEFATQLSTISFYDDFVLDTRTYLEIPGIKLTLAYSPSHLFACFFQLARAFYYIFSSVIGQTPTSAELRGAIWQSIFTHDMRRYIDGLFAKMGDMTTLVTGPSGTGKELVAKAIGLSRYIPFNTKTKSFEIDYQTSFLL